MRKLLLLAIVAAPALAHAGEVEITGLAGYSFPFYSQTFSYGPGAVSVGYPGLSLEQTGSFKLTASGGRALGAAIAFHPVTAFGVELRVDDASASIEAADAGFRVTATVPGLSAPVSETVTLTDGVAELDSLRSLSLNLKLRTTGSTKLYASGGISRLSGGNLRLRQRVALGVNEVNLVTGQLTISTLDLLADQGLQLEPNRWGGNLGIGFEIPVGEHGALVLEGRGFVFPKQQIEWNAVTSPAAGSLDAQLLDRVLGNLPVLEFEPWWVQASAGIAIRF